VGVRWLLPGADGEDVPRHETIQVPRERFQQEPAFFSRHLYPGGRIPDIRGPRLDWARRNRVHNWIHFNHALLHIIPPETYTKTHPHLFPIHIDRSTGETKRYLPPTNRTHHWQPCFSADGLAEVAVEFLCKFFRENPGTPTFSLAVNDGGGYCECEKCRARDAPEKSFLNRRNMSNLYYELVNRIAEGVLEEHPDKYFGCLAYNEVIEPPTEVRVHERVIPYYCYEGAMWADPELRETVHERLERWSEAAPTLGWWNYGPGLPFALPRVYFHLMAENFRFAHEHNVRALYIAGRYSYGEGPKTYLALKLAWDPYQDVDALLRDWYVRAVGEQAADDLAAYYAHWEGFWTRRIVVSLCV
jgi:hypothetical protein